MLKAVEGRVGLFRDQETGRIANMADYLPWETSDRFEGVTLNLPLLKTEAILMSWSLSSAKPLQPIELQQLVTLTHYGRVLGTSLVKTLLSERMRFPLSVGELMLAGAVTTATLSETPIEGADLRFHLHGYIKKEHGKFLTP